MEVLLPSYMLKSTIEALPAESLTYEPPNMLSAAVLSVFWEEEPNKLVLPAASLVKKLEPLSV